MVFYLDNYKRGVDDYFALNILPKIIGMKLRELLSKKNTQLMDNYLMKTFKITTRDVIEDVINNIEVTWEGNNCKIYINTNLYNERSGQKINTLMRLIDYGNLEVKGLKMFDEALMTIKKYFPTIYKLYKGGAFDGN